MRILEAWPIHSYQVSERIQACSFRVWKIKQSQPSGLCLYRLRTVPQEGQETVVTDPKRDFQEDLDSLPLFPSPTRVPKPMICGDYICIKETSFLYIIFRLNYLVQMHSSLDECHSKWYFYRYAYFDFKSMLSSQKLDFKIRALTHN